jgi:hypothetical protein
MPYSRPGAIQLVTATKAVWHGHPTVENNFVGVAVKIKAPAAGAGSGTPQSQIAIGEDFNLIKKGEVQVAAVSGAAKGDAIYIVAASNTLTKTAGGNVAFGRVSAVAGEKGCPSGFMRVDLDAKDGL